MPGDAGNKRAVRILLECILVARGNYTVVLNTKMHGTGPYLEFSFMVQYVYSDSTIHEAAGCILLQEGTVFRDNSSFMAYGAFILERKQKRRRFRSVALFPICVFILLR